MATPDDAASRPSLGLTLASLARWPMRPQLDLAADLRSWDMSSVWVAETVGIEAFAHLGALATVAPHLDLGTGVLAAPLRTPQLAAMGAASLQALSPDRSVHLGVGVSSPAVVGRWHGRPMPDRPIAFMRDHLEMISACWTGERVDRQSAYSSARGFRLGVPVGRRPRLVLGALNQRMLRLAGELCDGVLLNYLPASAVPWCVEQVRGGEREASRPDGSCRIHAYVHVGCGDPDESRRLAQRDLFSYVIVDAYAAAFTRAGFGDEVAKVRYHHERRERDEAIAAVSAEMCDAIDTVGDEARVTEAVTRYFEAGVDDVVIMPLPWANDQREAVGATCAAAAAAFGFVTEARADGSPLAGRCQTAAGPTPGP